MKGDSRTLHQKVSGSLSGVWYIVGLLVLIYTVFWFLSKVKIVLVLVSCSVVLAYILEPFMRYLVRRRVNKMLAITCVYLVLFAGIFAFLGILVPIIGDQFNRFVEDAPRIARQAEKATADANDWLEGRFPGVRLRFAPLLQKMIRDLELSAPHLVRRGFGVLAGVLALVVAVFLTPILTFHLLRDAAKYREGFVHFFPVALQGDAREILNRLNRTLGGFVRGQLIICAFIGITVTLALFLFQIEYALLIGFFAGVIEIIPYLGAFAGAIPALLIALFKNPLLALILAGVFFAIYEFQSKVFAPSVLGHEVGLSPFVVIVAILMGGELMGLFGMFIAVPVTAMLKSVMLYFRERYSSQPGLISEQ
ncbi:MAG: AI-2E family transporter [Armatimonadetes bacterium]|nr:AI-2E family transporter [Armatimonadota bacterium]